MRYFEDIQVGETESAGPYVLTEDEIVEFASRWDPHEFHLNQKAAEASVFQGLTASSAHTTVIATRLCHDCPINKANSIAAALSLSYRYPNPVRVGDQLTLEMEVIDKGQSTSRPHLGIVIQHIRLCNQNGLAVLDLESTVMVHTQPT